MEGIGKRRFSMTKGTAFHLMHKRMCHFYKLVLLVAEVM